MTYQHWHEDQTARRTITGTVTKVRTFETNEHAGNTTTCWVVTVGLWGEFDITSNTREFRGGDHVRVSVAGGKRIFVHEHRRAEK